MLQKSDLVALQSATREVRSEHEFEADWIVVIQAILAIYTRWFEAIRIHGKESADEMFHSFFDLALIKYDVTTEDERHYYRRALSLYYLKKRARAKTNAFIQDPRISQPVELAEMTRVIIWVSQFARISFSTDFGLGEVRWDDLSSENDFVFGPHNICDESRHRAHRKAIGVINDKRRRLKRM